MNKAIKSTYDPMVVIPIAVATLAVMGIIAILINARRRGVSVKITSEPLPGLELFGLWICLFFLNGLFSTNMRTYLLPGIYFAGFIVASVRYAWILKECTEVGWNWRIGLRQAWSIVIPALYALFVFGNLRDYSPTYVMQPVCQLVIAGVLTPLFLRGVYVRYQAERAERMRITYGGYTSRAGD